MKKSQLMRNAGAWGCAAFLAVGLAACAPASDDQKGKDGQDVAVAEAPVSNDTVVFGELERYSPEAAQQHEEGASLGFDEESNLQQEKTAGFSGGAVTSKLEKLPAGITGYSEGEPAGMNATTGDPKEVPHGSANGTDCLSCHAAGEQQVPASHTANNVANENCTSCHVIG